MRIVGVAPVKSLRIVTVSPGFTVIDWPRASPVGENVKTIVCGPGSTRTRAGQLPRDAPSTLTTVPGSPRRGG